jgi:hypothetical protein
MKHFTSLPETGTGKWPKERAKVISETGGRIFYQARSRGWPNPFYLQRATKHCLYSKGRTKIFVRQKFLDKRRFIVLYCVIIFHRSLKRQKTYLLIKNG